MDIQRNGEQGASERGFAELPFIRQSHDVKALSASDFPPLRNPRAGAMLARLLRTRLATSFASGTRSPSSRSIRTSSSTSPRFGRRSPSGAGPPGTFFGRRLDFRSRDPLATDPISSSFEVPSRISAGVPTPRR